MEESSIFDSREGFERLFRMYYAPLCRKAWNYVRDVQQSEDIVQDVFVKCWENRKQIRIKQSVQAYLNRAVVNACLNMIRENAPSFLSDMQEIDKTSYSHNSDTLLAKEADDKYRQLLDSLPPACRTVFILAREEDMSYREISESLGISIKTVENQMGKALKVLREKIMRYIGLIICCLKTFYFFY